MHEQPLADVELPIVRELGEALYTAALAVDGHAGIRVARTGRKARRSAARVKRRHGLRQPPLMAMVALSLLVLLAAVAAAGTLVGGIGITPEQWLSGKRATPPTAITAAQSAHLAILRRSRVASQDAVDADGMAQLSHGTFMGAAGADFGLSRRVRGVHGGVAWIVPAAQRACLIAYSNMDTGTRHGRDRQAGAVCEPDAAIAKGRMAIFGPRRGGGEFVAGVVPDGVPTVRLTLSTGATETAVVHENVYLTQVPGSVVYVSLRGTLGGVTVGPFAVPISHLGFGACVRRQRDVICPKR